MSLLQHRSFKLSWMLIALLLFAGAPITPCLAMPEQTKKVLVLYSYGPDIPVQGLFTKGLQSRLRQSQTIQVEYMFEYLDMSKYSSQAFSPILSRFLREKCAMNRPDLIITHFDPAAKFMTEYGGQAFPGIPAVFGMYEGEGENFSDPPENYRQVVGYYGMKTAVDLILQIQPQTQKIYVIAGDSERERKSIAAFSDMAANFAGKVEFIYLNKMPFKDMLETAKRISGKAVILYIFLFRDVAGNEFIPGEALQRLHQAAAVPIYSSVSIFIGRGTLGGYMASQEVLGAKTAETALTLLRGDLAAHNPTEKTVAAEYIFDGRELKRWGIDESSLPSGSRIEFKQYSVWELYKWQLIGGVCCISFLSLLVVMLWMNRRRLKTMEKALRLSNAQLEINVGERTAELAASNKDLSISNEELRALNEEMLVMNENLDGLNREMTKEIKERQRMEEELRQARQKADEATLAKSMFLANMSHEIRTPMNAIIGMAYLALKTHLTAKQYDYVDKIHKAGSLLLGIINEILDFSKIEAGKLQLDPVSFVLDEVMDTVFNLTHSQATAKGLEFVYHIAPDIPQNLVGDPLRIIQIMTNLINNAVKFTESGSITLIGKMIAKQENTVTVQFSITDTGIGMNPDQVAKLFQSFTQADGSTTRKYGGTGLGLTISKKLVEMMGGSIIVDSLPGAGSTFTFTLCLELASEAEGKQRIVPEKFRHLRVLVVDDNPAVRETLLEYLRTMNCRADAAASGQDAIDEVLRSSDDPYSMILMEWQMSGMDGIEAACRIKNVLGVAHPPAIVMITSFDREELYAQVRQYKLDGVLIKPVTPSHLLDATIRLFAPGAELKRMKQPAQERNYEIAGLRILLAEDNEINQQIAVELLESQGAEVTVAHDGREAVDAVLKEAAQGGFDLILMDLQMPNMDGFEATKEIRTYFEQLPIIAMTAHAMAEERESCLKAGMNDHVGKPIEPDVLFETLARWAPRKQICGLLAPNAAVLSAGNDRDVFVTAISQEDTMLDKCDGLKRVAGNEALYHKLLRQYIAGQADAADRLREMLTQGDMNSGKRIAHTLKGVSGNIGATAIAQIAAALEAAINSPGNTNEILVLVDQLELSFAKLRLEIQAYLPSETAAASMGQSKPLNTELIHGLRKLNALLADKDIEAIDCFESLYDDFAAILPLGELKELKRQMFQFEWEAVQQRLASMLQEGEPA